MLPTIGKPFVRSQILKNAHQLTLYWCSDFCRFNVHKSIAKHM